MRFYISGSGDARPPSSAVIYCDGSADSSYRPSVDLELSHWVPNRTPSRYRADTSTEICLNFVADAPDGDFDLAVNNHLDVDGILAVFVLVEHTYSLRHRELLIEAAEMGDFWSWGREPAQVLFQGLTIIYRELEESDADVQTIYETCFARIPALVDQSDEIVPQARASLVHLQESVNLIESHTVRRTEIHERFVLYEIPSSLAPGQLERALYAPEFNEPISDKALLWPHARARHDEQKVALIAVECERGWYYDLWYPGYTWADTPHRWRPPGVYQAGQINDHLLDHPQLGTAVDSLQRAETSVGSWWKASDFSAFGDGQTVRRPFPIAASFVDNAGIPVASALAPNHVAQQLARCFN